MDSERRQVVAYAIIGFLLTATVIGAAAHLSGTLQNTGVPVAADDGMTVTVEGTAQQDLSDFADSLGGTVYIVTESGNATFSSSGPANATVHKDEIEGPWTNVTDIDADPNSIQIDPEDKSQVTVAQQITSISFTGSYTADDGDVDFAYGAASGPGEVTLTSAPASTTLYAIDAQSGTILDSGDSDGSGSVTFNGLDSGSHDVVLQTGVNKAPTLSNASPTGGLSQEPTTFSVDVKDANLGDGDTVDVTISLDGTQIHSETITSNTTVTTSVPADGKLGGSHQWTVDAQDDFGGSTSDTYSYKVPSNITFRHEQPSHGIIENGTTDPITVQATFFEDASSDPLIVNRTTTDGTLDLDGLPVSSEFSVSVSSPGYHNRTVRLENIFEQNTIFLIEKGTAMTVENRFVVNDRTGNFPPGETEISIQAPVNQSLYDTGGFAWLTVSGDDLGADQAYVDDLIEEKRYRIVVENNDGDTRILGAYTPETTGTIELNIGSVEVQPEQPGGVGFNATWYNASGSENVRVEYSDTSNATETLYVDIYERDNESNTLVDNLSFTGTFGTFSHVEPVPEGEKDTTWVVEVRGVRSTNDDGENVENIHFKESVGPGMPVLTDLPQWLVTLIFVGLILGVAGLFSQVNGHVGGLVVAGLGAMLYFVGLTPGYLGGGVVALSLLVAGILFVRGSRGGI